MKVIIMMILSVLASFFSFPSVDAKCCRAFTTCGDGTEDYTCCGYGKCNGFCCSCDGVTEFEYSLDPGKTATLSVLDDKTWTCRDNRDPSEYTLFGYTKRSLPTPIAGPLTTPAPRSVEEAEIETYDLLMSVSDGTGQVTKDQYLDYHGAEAGSERETAIINDFEARDMDNSGSLNRIEIDRLCYYVLGAVHCDA